LRRIKDGIKLKHITTEIRSLNRKITVDFVINTYYHYHFEIGTNPEETSDIITKFDKSLRAGGSRFKDTQNLDNYMRGIDANYIRYMSEDKEKITNLRSVHQFLMDQKIIHPFSGFNVTGYSYNTSPLYKGTRNAPTIDRGIDIFDSSRATIFTPYIVYTDGKGISYYKIIRGNLDYEDLKIIKSGNEGNKPNSIFMTVWLGGTHLNVSKNEGITDIYDSTLISKANSTSFYKVYYDIEGGVMTASLSNKSRVSQIKDR